MSELITALCAAGVAIAGAVSGLVVLAVKYYRKKIELELKKLETPTESNIGLSDDTDTNKEV